MVDYRISDKKGAEACSVLAKGITTTSYTASSLTADAILTLKVTVRDLVGLGTDSFKVGIKAAVILNVPAAPSKAAKKRQCSDHFGCAI